MEPGSQAREQLNGHVSCPQCKGRQARLPQLRQMRKGSRRSHRKNRSSNSRKDRSSNTNNIQSDGHIAATSTGMKDTGVDCR